MQIKLICIIIGTLLMARWGNGIRGPAIKNFSRSNRRNLFVQVSTVPAHDYEMFAKLAFHTENEFLGQTFKINGVTFSFCFFRNLHYGMWKQKRQQGEALTTPTTDNASKSASAFIINDEMLLIASKKMCFFHHN